MIVCMNLGGASFPFLPPRRPPVRVFAVENGRQVGGAGAARHARLGGAVLCSAATSPRRAGRVCKKKRTREKGKTSGKALRARACVPGCSAAAGRNGSATSPARRPGRQPEGEGVGTKLGEQRERGAPRATWPTACRRPGGGAAWKQHLHFLRYLHLPAHSRT